MRPTIKRVERLTMSSPEILEPVFLTVRAQAGERPLCRRSCSRSPESTPKSVSRLEDRSSVGARLTVSESVAEPVMMIVLGSQQASEGRMR